MNYKFSDLYTRLDKSIELIQQYCELVANCYQEDLHIKDFKLNAWDVFFDDCAHPVIIMSGKEVVGGSILYVRSVNDNQQLPLEKSTGVNLNQIIKSHNLPFRNNISEMSKTSVKAKYRDRRITQEITNIIVAKALKEGCEATFALPTSNQSRNISIICKKIGLEYITLYSDMPEVPMYNGIKPHLTYANYINFDTSKLLGTCHFTKLISQLCDISYKSHYQSGPMLLQNSFLDHRI